MRPLKLSLVLALIAALIVAGVASAHADILSSNPPANSTLDAAPSQVTIKFTEAIEPAFSKITVLFEDGSTIDGGDSAVSPTDPTLLTVSLNDQRQGTYIVSWRVLSAADGHITSGAFVFSVGKPINATTATESSQNSGAVTSPLDMLARAFSFIGQALIAGTLLFRWLVWRPALASAQLDDEVDHRAIQLTKHVVLIALGLGAIGAVLTLLVQTTLSGGTIGTWLGTRVGRVWMGRAATLITIGILAGDFAASGRGRGWRAALTNIVVGWIGLQLLFLTSLTSHSAAVTTPPVIPLLVDFVHLIGTALWVGGLAQMAFVVPRVAKSLAAEDRAWLWLKTVVYFSTVAAVGVGVLIITGTYLSFLNVGDWAALIGTVYGQTLLIKLALAGLAMLIGAYNLFVVKPRLDQSVESPAAAPAQKLQKRFRRVVLLEAVAGMLVLTAAGVLTDLPRSKDPQPITTSGPLQLTTQTDNVNVALTIDPARSGLARYDVRVSQNGTPITDATNVSLRFTYRTRGLGTTNATATLTPDGLYSASGAYLALSGEWQVEVAVRRPNAYDAFAAYRLKVNGNGSIEAAGAETLFDTLTRWLSIYGSAFGGGLAIALGAIWLVIGLKAARNPWSQIILLIPTLIAVPLGVRSMVTFFNEATPGLTLVNPFLPDEQSLAAGGKLFEANCAVCHGPAGRGNGPAAAGLRYPPPDYGNGHLDIHTDGDIFYWIQNGLGTNQSMPAFKGKLSDDDTWNLVNYVRRLRNEAGSAPATPPGSSLQPYTPPSFIAPNVVVTSSVPITPTPSAPNDPAALKLLAQSDAAMNTLTSMVEDQTLHDDAGNQLSVRFEYAAPDRLRYAIAGGATSTQIGLDDYQQKPDGTWLKNQRAVPFQWPGFAFSQQASGARIDGTDQVAGVQATIVTFNYSGFDAKFWIDAASHRVLKFTMDGPDHHMASTYSQFNAAPQIDPPIP